MPLADCYSSMDVTTLNIRRTPIKKQPEVLLCLVGLSRNFFLGDDVYGLVQTDQCLKSDEGEIHSVENPAVTEVVPKLDPGREVAAMGPLVNKRCRKRGNDKADANAPPKADSTFFAPASQETPVDVSDPNPLCYAKPQPILEQDIAQSSKGAATSGNPDFDKSSSFTSMLGSPGIPPRYFLELRHLPNDDSLSQYNINLVRQVAMGSQLRLRFEQEVRLLKKATTKIAKRDQRIQVREEEIKKLDQEIKSLWDVDTEVQGLHNQTRNLETLLEAEVDMQKRPQRLKMLN
ncbi:hypothetical protein Tco_0716644 [Tanacetum coccineum]